VRLFYLTLSRMKYAQKRQGRIVAITLMVLTLLIEMPLRFTHAVFTGSFRDGLYILGAVLLFLRRHPKVVKS